MLYRSLGRSGLRVSELALGSWLTYGDSLAEERAITCIHRAYDLGINLFDTADAYNNGQAEVTVGKALKSFSRTSYVLATKVYFPMGDGPNDRGLGRKHIIEGCHASLRRLGVDYIDLYQCHRFDESVPLEETLRALEDLIIQGKVLYAGVSEWTAEQIAAALKVGGQFSLHRLVSNQPRYNMFQRGIEAEVITLCEREGIGQIVFSPLAQGMLTGKYRRNQTVPEGSRATTASGKGFIQRFMTDENYTKVEKLQELAADCGMPLAKMVLAWVLRLTNISSAIIGASRPEQIEENVKAVGVQLEPTILERIEAILTD